MAEEKLRKDMAVPEEKKDNIPEDSKAGVSATWAEETIADLDEFIESQGIYIRQ